MSDDAGALLVRSGLVSSSALDDARARVADIGGTLVEQLVAGGVVSDDQLTGFFKSRLLVPQVNPNTLARLPAKIVALIPSDMAIELRVIPVSHDSDNNLTVAMSDPSDRHAVDEIAFFTGAYVVRAVATQMQIAWCLAHYYGHVTFLGQRLLQPGSPEAVRAAQAAVRPPRPKGITGKIDAARHRAIPPGVAVDAPRPHTPTLDEETPPHGRPEAAPSGDGIPRTQPRSRSVSGEIRLPSGRAPSIKPPEPIYDEESGPVISIEADAADEAPPATPSVPRRTRPAKSDPPELAARAGEIGSKTGPVARKMDEEPRVVIEEGLDWDGVPERISRAHTAPLEQAIEASGEVAVRVHPDHGSAPSINIEIGEEPSAPVVIHDYISHDSAPILLDRRRPSDAPTNVAIPAAPIAIDDEPSDVVVLDARKERPARPDRTTQVGIGVLPATTRPKRDTEDERPGELDDQPTGSRRVDIDATRVDAHAVPPGDYTTSDEILAAPPSPVVDDDTSPIAPPVSAPMPPPSGQIRFDRVRPASRSPDEDDDDDDPRGSVRGIRATAVMTTLELDAVIPGRKSDVVPAHLERRFGAEPTEDGWGPPGTTIPPALLGAIPGSVEPTSGIIPLPSMDAPPLFVAPPAPPELGRPATHGDAGLSRALEDATTRVLELIRSLEHAIERDEVIAVMIQHLSDTHRRAGFFAARSGELQLFALTPRPVVLPIATLRLDRPSTLQDVVGTRLPYRGPMVDDASRTFLTSVLGACPPEILLVPVTVRERAVGVLFGEHRLRHTFDDQLALAARAAGAALERILKAKRG